MEWILGSILLFIIISAIGDEIDYRVEDKFNKKT